MDLEMTFADQDVIMRLTEDLMRTVFREVNTHDAQEHVPAVRNSRQAYAVIHVPVGMSSVCIQRLVSCMYQSHNPEELQRQADCGFCPGRSWVSSFLRHLHE